MFRLQKCALTEEAVDPVLSYASYLLSSYALIITITGITGVVRLIRQGIGKAPFVKKLLENPLVSRYLQEDMFRAEAALYQGFLVNLLLCRHKNAFRNPL